MRAADMQRRKARTSLLAGDLQAAGDIFSAGSKLGWLAYNAQPYTPTSVRSNSDPRRIGSLY